VSNLVQQVEKSIAERRLFGDGRKILVAVSGGVDSMVLLHLLARLSKKHGWQLTAAHFNHQLRGRSSDADEGLVRAAAGKLGLKCVTGRADVRKYTRRHKLSIEMAGRKLRHEFLARTARRLGIRTVALAHHADDQVELFFLRVLRGAGGEGLGGMRWRNPSPADVRSPAFRRQRADRLKAALQTQLVRPLLDVSKAELEKFARENRIRFREDASNASLDILRNRIRNVLLPWLNRKFGAATSKTVPRLMEIVRGEADFVTETAQRCLRSTRRRQFERLPVAVQRRCLQLQLVGQGITVDFGLIEHLRLKPDKPVVVRPGVAVQRNRVGKVHVRRTGEKPDTRQGFDGKSMRADLRERAGEVAFSGNRICWEIRPGSGRRPQIRRAACEVFDADKVGSSVILRHWRAGDRFQPIGMTVPAKLQDVFTNQKVPRDLRHRLVVAATRRGEIFWVEGLRIGERFKLDKRSRRRLKWTWQPL